MLETLRRRLSREDLWRTADSGQGCHPGRGSFRHGMPVSVEDRGMQSGEVSSAMQNFWLVELDDLQQRVRGRFQQQNEDNHSICQAWRRGLRAVNGVSLVQHGRVRHLRYETMEQLVNLFGNLWGRPAGEISSARGGQRRCAFFWRSRAITLCLQGAWLQVLLPGPSYNLPRDGEGQMPIRYKSTQVPGEGLHDAEVQWQ